MEMPQANQRINIQEYTVFIISAFEYLNKILLQPDECSLEKATDSTLTLPTDGTALAHGLNVAHMRSPFSPQAFMPLNLQPMIRRKRLIKAWKLLHVTESKDIKD